MDLGKPLRRRRTRRKIFFAALLLFAVGVLGATGFTSAFYAAELDTKTATFAGGYVAVPTISTVTPSGYDGVVVWTNGTDQTTTDNEIQQIFGADQAATNNCTGASYSTTVANSITSPTTTQAFTYSDSNRATTPSNINGNWYCYEVVHGWPNTTTPAWTTPTTALVQIGLAPTSVVISNGNKAGQIDAKGGNHDTIVITYNQPVAMTSGTGNSDVCSYQTEGVILLGDTACATAAGDSYTVGVLSMPVTNGGEHKKAGATISVSGNQITVSITQAGANVTNSGITFVSSSNGGTVVSAATTDQATACTTGVNCTIGASGGF